MDAIEILRIVREYDEGKLEFSQASLQLVFAGCNAEEVRKLLQETSSVGSIMNSRSKNV